MRTFIKDLLIFSIFSILFYVVLVCLFGSLAHPYLQKNLQAPRGGYGYLNTRIKEADTTGKVDILVLGSSHAYRGYDPRIFKQHGLTMFNLGSSAQTPFHTNLLLEKYIDSMKPDAIIFDVYPPVFENIGTEASVDFLANANLGAEMMYKIIKSNLNIKIINNAIYALFRRAFNFDKNFKEALEKDDDKYISGGYAEIYKKYKRQEIKSTKKGTMLDWQVEAFAKSIELIKSKNIKLLLVQTPVVAEAYNARGGKEITDSFFSAYGNYIDFNKIMVLDDDCFYDNSHLNQYGVNKFNDALIRAIETEF